MMKEKNSIKNFIWNAIGLTANSIVSLVFLIVVKLFNGVEDAGIFTYSYSLCILFYYVSIYYNRPFQIANATDDKKFNSFFSARIITSITSLIIIIIFSLISGFSFYKISIIFLLMLFKTCDAVSDVFHGDFQKKENLYMVGISYVLKSFFGIVIFVILDYLTSNLIISILGLILINVIIFMFYDYKKFKLNYDKKLFLDFTDIKFILKSSLPIFLFQFISIYLVNCEKYVITYFSSNELQTIFGILIMPATVLSLVGNYLLLPFINKLHELNVKGNLKDFMKLGNKILLVLFGFGILALGVCYLIGIPVLNFIYQIKLSKYKLDLLLIVIGAIFNSGGMICSGMLTILGKNKIQVYIYGVVSIVTTVLCYLLIKKDIIFGASLTYLISCMILFTAFLIIYIKNVCKRKVI